MILQILDDTRHTILFEIRAIDEAPYGIEEMPDGGYSLSHTLRMELTRFLYESNVMSMSTATPHSTSPIPTRNNVVRFKARQSTMEFTLPTAPKEEQTDD